MKNIAIITESCARFRAYKSGQFAIGENHNFIHVTSTDGVKGLKLNDHVSLSTRFKMPDHDAIVKEVVNNINQSV